MSKVCNAGKEYGMTVLAPRKIDRHGFPAVPGATKEFEKLCKGRPTAEQVNARLKIFRGL